MSISDRDLIAGEFAFGRTPSLVIVDMSYGFTDPDSPLGGDFAAEVSVAAKLCDFFAQQGWPVFCSSVVYDLERQPLKASVFRQRLPDLNILKKGSHWCDIDEQIPHQNHYQVVEKQWPSAFFDTSLTLDLLQAGSDSVVVCGLTTSGCVRATVLDALQHNFPCWVAQDACGDRNHTAHKANLHDMNAKYAKVMSSGEVIQALSR
jgi:nicotinamidase-related amidase